MIARSFERLGRGAEARSHFKALAATKPRAVDPARPLEVRMEAHEGRSADLHAKALDLLGLGRLPEARAALADARAEDPDNPWGQILNLEWAVTRRTSTPASSGPASHEP